MDGNDINLMNLFYEHNRYIIPQYQRHYKWEFKNWHSLIRDIVNLDTRIASEPKHHWMGIFLISEGKFIPGKPFQEFVVIDGQQRLVTLRLWLAALEHSALDAKTPLEEMIFSDISVQEADLDSYRAAINNEWRNPKWRQHLKTGTLGCYYYFRWILWLGETGLLANEPVDLPKIHRNPKSRIEFEDEWKSYCEKKSMPHGLEPSTLSRLRDLTLQQLKIFFLKHQAVMDEEQAVIFDTLNGNRTPLEPLDHVRNSIFVRITSRASAEEMYKEIWQPLEKRIFATKVRRIGAETRFLYDYLISRGEKKRQGSINSERGAAHFARMTSSMKDEQLIQFLRDEFSYSMATWPVVVGTSNETDVCGRHFKFEEMTIRLIRSIYELTEGPAVPAVLLYLSSFTQGATPTEDELRKYLRLIEAYVARYILAGRPLSPLRSRFMQILSDIDCRLDFNILKEAITKDWPYDDEVKEYSADAKKPYYNAVRSLTIGALLRGAERCLSSEGANWFRLGKGEGDYNVEHIYPQSGKKWERNLLEWKQDKAEMDSMVHMLGNLTVVTAEHNQKVANGTLAEKQKYAEKSEVAPLRINDSWIKQRRWTAKEIRKRNEELIKAALNYWSLTKKGH